MAVSPAKSTARREQHGTRKSSEAPPSHAGSLLQRPTEASLAVSHGFSMGSVLSRGSGKPPRKELTFRQKLLKKTIKESIMRPSGVMALHIKRGHFYDIDSGGMFMSDTLLGSFWDDLTRFPFVQCSVEAADIRDSNFEFCCTFCCKSCNHALQKVRNKCLTCHQP